MLLVGSGDGVYRVTGVFESGETSARRVLQSGRVLRVRTFEGVDGAFAAATTGLYYSPDGEGWTDAGVPRETVYAVGATPDGDAVYAGTRPAHAYVARPGGGGIGPDLTWRELDGFRDLASRDDWGISRHEDVAQVRDLVVHPEAPDRVVAGVEVGGVYVSEDGGESWADRRVRGFDAPHTDDIHHVAMADGETVVAATGSGLYRTTDVGRTWERLDADHRQTYFRESFVRDGLLFAGGSPTPPSSWEADADHALFERREGRGLERAASPTPEEVAVGWCVADGDVLAATHRGTLLARRGDGWRVAGSVPAPERVHGRCIPLAWLDR